MMRTKHTEGFTVAELLTVVAILAVLAGIVVVSLVGYMRNLTLNEYDSAAKSLYLAAQNSMADLQASGEWVENKTAYTSGDAKKPTAPRTDDDNKTQGHDDLYYYVSAQFARDNGILPAGSIEAEVWSNDYIIEYRYDTATVYGVFYTEGGQDVLDAYYSNKEKPKDDVRDRDTRRDNEHNIIVGYYGGASAANLDSVTLDDPIVSAGRSPALGVTDPNLAKSELDTTKLVTLVTIEKVVPEGTAQQPKQLKLMLRRSGFGLPEAHIVVDNGKPEPVEGVVSMSGTDKTTYSIDLAKLKAVATASPYLSDIATGDEYRVTARVTTSEKLCRPAYGYGTGIWPGEGEDVIFTSNIIADYEKEADLYVYRDEVNEQADGGGKGRFVTFNLENWYNDRTSANENLYYRFENDERITIDSVTEAGGNVVRQVNNDYYAYPFDAKKNVPHQVTFSIKSIKNLVDGATMDIKVNAFRENENASVPGELSKTLTIHVHVMNQRPFDYHVEDHGSYAEVVVTAGSRSTGTVNIAPKVGGVVSDESSTAYEKRENSGERVTLHSISAGSSVSIKYFKTDMSITLDENTFIVQQ